MSTAYTDSESVDAEGASSTEINTNEHQVQGEVDQIGDNNLFVHDTTLNGTSQEKIPEHEVIQHETEVQGLRDVMAVEAEDMHLSPRQDEQLREKEKVQQTSTSPPPTIISPAGKRDVDSEDERDYVVDPSSIATEKIRKKIPGKVIDSFWTPLSSDSYESVQRIISMCINQSIQRYNNKSIPDPSKKMLEAQNILREAWQLSSNRNDSFSSRLRDTPLPLPNIKTSGFGYSSSSGSKTDLFNYDKLLRRKKYLETYLSAEQKQLNELEKNYKNHEIVYDMDKKYLDQLRKTTEKEIVSMTQEITRKRKSLQIDRDTKIGDESTKINKGRKLNKNGSTFDPNEDYDTIQVLSSLQRHLSSIKNNTSNLKDINAKLEQLFYSLEGETK